MFSKEFILSALENGSKNGYELFPEIRHKDLKGKIREDEITEKMAQDIQKYAATALNQPSPVITFTMFKEFEKSGNRLTFENAYFGRRKQLFSLVLAYILEEDDKYIPVIEEKLWEWCELYSWELTAHIQMYVKSIEDGSSEPDKTVALFAAESGFFFAEILSIIGDKLDQFLVYRLKKEIVRRIIKPYKDGSFSWENAKMNWASVCSGSVGAAAMYLLEDNEELAAIIERVIKTMEVFIDAFDSDGLITEGLDYWSYGFSFYVYFAELLSERTCGDISLLHQSEKIKKIAALPQILQFPARDFVNFSDASTEKWNGDYGLFSKLGKVLDIQGYSYPDEDYILKDHTFRWASMARKIFWTVGGKRERNTIVKTGMFLFRESQWIVDRRETESGKFTAFAAKGGNNDEPHNHNDLGHFILNYDGDRIFIDIGSPEYVKEYFRDETRYDFLAASSLGHSVPTINNHLQSAGQNYYSDKLRCEEISGETYFKLNLEKAYNCKELSVYEREFTWSWSKLKLKIRDSFQFGKPGYEIKESFITKVEPLLAQPGIVLIETDKCITELEFSPKLRCIIEKCSFNNHSGSAAVVYRTTVILKNISETTDIDFNISVFPKANK